MKPSARVQACIEIFEKIETAKVPMDAVVGDYMRGRRYIGAKDRANIAERVYGIMRARARLGWWIERAGAKVTPRNLLLAWLILTGVSTEDSLKEFFDGGKFSAPEINNDDLELFHRLKGKTLDSADMPEAVRAECPPEYEAVLREYFGDDFLKELQAMQDSAPLDMRANVFLMDREKVKDALAKSGVEVDETPFSPWGLRARGKVFLSKTKAFLKGWVEIQDEGSQMIAAVCDVKPGMQVLDFCAGGGGKTLALGAAMMRKGRIVAMDLDERRLAKGKERFRKAQIADIIEVRPLSDDKQRKWLKRQKETFDVILLDVPCTGTGTWRRNPDTRWKQHGPGLEELVKIQAEILDKVASSAKKGGRIVYATCSILPAENEEQVEAFLKRNADFKVKPVEERLGNPYMRLTPLRHNTDGMFAAVLEKQ